MNFSQPCQSLNQISRDFYDFHDFTQYKTVQAVLGIVYSLIFLFGMLGNLSIIASIAKRKRICMVANIFLVNLSVTQIVLCLTTLPITPITLIRKTWEFGQIFCKVFPLCQIVSVLLISLSLCCIAIDRYRNIVHPTRSRWTAKTAIFLIMACLICAIFINIPLMMAQQLIPFHDPQLNITYCGMFCGEFGWNTESPHKKIYGSTVLFIQFGLPVIAMTFCYWKILVKVKNDLIIGAYADRPHQAQAAARKRSIMRILVMMVVAFVGSWLPLALMNILRDFDVYLPYLDEQVYLSQLGAHAVAMTSVIWNPILYFWMSKSHRNALKRKFTESKLTMVKRASFFLHRNSTPGQHNYGESISSVYDKNKLSPLLLSNKTNLNLRNTPTPNSNSTASTSYCHMTKSRSLHLETNSKSRSAQNVDLSLDPFADDVDDCVATREVKRSLKRKPRKESRSISKRFQRFRGKDKQTCDGILMSFASAEEETQLH